MWRAQIENYTGRWGAGVVPHSSDIVTAIEQNRQEDIPTDGILYVALIEALRRERSSVTAYADEAIVWTLLGYVSPSNALMSPKHARLFLDAVPVANPRSVKAAEALRRLGCRTRPVPADWAKLVASISKSVGPGEIVSASDRSRLLQAYSELEDGIPDGTGLTRQSFVLGRDGRLHDPGHAFIDDHPQLAEQLGATVPIAQDSSQAALRFYDSCGVRRLSEAAIPSPPQIGDPQDAPNRIGAAKTRKQLKSSTFRSALSALINREVSDRKVPTVSPTRADRLPRVESITFVDAISQEYKLVGASVSVQAHHHWEGTTLYVALPPSRNHFRDYVSYALVEAATGSTAIAKMLSTSIYRLLECGSTEEIAGFLAHRGIPWQMDLPFEDWDREHPQPDDELIAEQIGGLLTSSLEGRAGRTEADPPPSSGREPPAEPKREDRILPSIDKVKAYEIAPAWNTHGCWCRWYWKRRRRRLVSTRSGMGPASRCTGRGDCLLGGNQEAA